MIGATFSNPVIVQRAADGQSMVVRLGLRFANGETESFTMQFRKNSAGSWQMAGDRQLADLMVKSINQRFLSGATTYYSRYLEAWVDAAANAGQRMVIAGPGLPVSGVSLARLTATGDGGAFGIEAYQYGGSWVHECASGTTVPATLCINFSQVPAGASYLVKYYDSNGAQLGENVSMVLEQPPVSNELARANADKWFPSFNGSFSPASYNNLTNGTNGTNITIGWTAPTDSAYRTSNIGLNDGQGNWFSTDVTQGANTLLLGTWNGPAPDFGPSLCIGSEGPYNRRFVTNWHYPQ